MPKADADGHLRNRVREAIADADSGEVYSRFDPELATDNVMAIIDASSDEGMLREAHDILRSGVSRWNNQNFAWIADDLVQRIAARFPDSKDVIEHG